MPIEFSKELKPKQQSRPMNEGLMPIEFSKELKHSPKHTKAINWLNAY